jgi:hypothetical protein
MVMTPILLGAAYTFRVPERDVFAALEANDKEVHKGVGTERRPPLQQRRRNKKERRPWASPSL